jgi:lipid II:glycine glycyltransferase (peptidoglycan interpeptide bridge formation enzyme)
VKKAIKNGVMVEKVKDANDITSFIEEYYRQLKDVFKKQGLVPTYSIDRLVGLYQNLTKDSIISLRAKYNGRTIATGIFPHDEKRIYFFGGASWSSDNFLCPNDLIHWEVMRLASKASIKEYDTCGGGSFKHKFGHPFTPHYRYFKSYSHLAKIGRDVYRFKFNFLQKIKGSLN